MTPKSLLRLEAARSHVDEMEEGREFSFDLNLPIKYSQYGVAVNKSLGVKPKFPIDIDRPSFIRPDAT